MFSFRKFLICEAISAADAYGILDIPAGTVINLNTLKAFWKKAISTAHPDRGGSTEKAQTVNAANDVLKQAIERMGESDFSASSYGAGGTKSKYGRGTGTGYGGGNSSGYSYQRKEEDEETRRAREERQREYKEKHDNMRFEWEQKKKIVANLFSKIDHITYCGYLKNAFSGENFEMKSKDNTMYHPNWAYTFNGDRGTKIDVKIYDYNIQLYNDPLSFPLLGKIEMEFVVAGKKAKKRPVEFEISPHAKWLHDPKFMFPLKTIASVTTAVKKREENIKSKGGNLKKGEFVPALKHAFGGAIGEAYGQDVVFYGPNKTWRLGMYRTVLVRKGAWHLSHNFEIQQTFTGHDGTPKTRWTAVRTIDIPTISLFEDTETIEWMVTHILPILKLEYDGNGAALAHAFANLRPLWKLYIDEKVRKEKEETARTGTKPRW